MKLFDRVRRRKVLSFSLLLFTLSLGIVIGTLVNTGVHAARAQSAAPDATPLTIPNPVLIGNEFTKLAKKLEPSVVNITADASAKEQDAPKGTRRGPQPPQGQDEEDNNEDNTDLFRRFFHQPFNNDMPQRALKREQSGTGFLVDAHGYILTNNHVVDKMDHIKVRLHGDLTDYKARLIGVDVETDIAVIKIEPHSPLTPVTIANSEGVQVGDWAVAIGSPFGLEASVTAGIVSATGRDIGTQAFQRFIQTDAAINPGNSGGPLLNIRGDVIGVNTMIATQSGGYQGIGFALPMNTAVKVYNDIIKTGRVTRGSIGISWNKNDKPELLKALGAKNGVLVADVSKGGPADKAGLKAEDIVVAINGKEIKDGDDLVTRVADMAIGAAATLTVDRGGKRMDLKLVIADRSEVFKNDPRVTGLPPEANPSKVEGTPAKFGIFIRDLSPAEKEAANPPEGHGVRVTRVEAGSFAEDLQIQDQDIIVSINRQPVSSKEDVQKVQSALKPGDAVAFRIMRSIQAAPRGGKPQYNTFFVSGTLPPVTE